MCHLLTSGASSVALVGSPLVPFNPSASVRLQTSSKIRIISRNTSPAKTPPLSFPPQRKLLADKEATETRRCTRAQEAREESLVAAKDAAIKTTQAVFANELAKGQTKVQLIRMSAAFQRIVDATGLRCAGSEGLGPLVLFDSNQLNEHPLQHVVDATRPWACGSMY